jgi:hypothetical protein
MKQGIDIMILIMLRLDVPKLWAMNILGLL